MTLLFAATACAGPDVPAADSRNTAAPGTHEQAWRNFLGALDGKWEGKTLRIIGRDDRFMHAFDRIVPEFERITGADVITEWYGYQTTYLRETFTGNNRLPSTDVVLFDTPWVGEFAEARYVEPLGPYLARTPKTLVSYEDFFRVMREGATWGDDIVGLPFAPNFIVTIHNEEILRDAGVRPPRDLNEFVDVAQAVQDSRVGSAANAYGVALNNQSGSALGQAYFEYIYAMGGRPFASEYPGSPDQYADMTPQFTSPESLAVVNLFKRLLPMQPPGALERDWTGRFNAFADGRVGMIRSWNDDVRPLTDPNTSDVADQVRVEPPLHAPGVEATTPVGGWEMGINRFSEQKDMAWDFIVWFTSPEVGTVFAGTGGSPARYSVLHNPDLVADNPYYRTLQDIVDQGYPAFRPQIPESFEVIEILGAWLSKALYDELPPEDAMARAEQEIGGLLADAGYHVRR